MTTFHALYQSKLVSLKAHSEKKAVQLFNDTYDAIYRGYNETTVFSDGQEVAKKRADYMVTWHYFVNAQGEQISGFPISRYAQNYDHALIIYLQVAGVMESLYGKGRTETNIACNPKTDFKKDGLFVSSVYFTHN